VADGGVWTDKYYPFGGTAGGGLRPHHGVEFDVPAGSAVLAAAAGTVEVAGADDLIAYGESLDFYGNLVIIRHDWQVGGLPVYSLYGHLSEILVAPGQVVAARELIAYSGATGRADGPHLHFEVRVGANSYTHSRNPLLWLAPFTGRGVVAGRVVFPGGGPAYSAPVTLRRLDAPSAYSATTTYADASVQADDGWQENFALDDVVAGYYELSVDDGDKQYRAHLWVFPAQTTFVEIVVGG
jgi:hypothetical protein